MNKYLLIRPSDLWKYDSVDIEGNYPHIKIDDFAVSKNVALNEKFNYVMFEVPFKETHGSKVKRPNEVIGDAIPLIEENKVKFSNEATEIFSGYKFNINVEKDAETGEYMVELGSDELGLYLCKPLKLNDVIVKPSKVSGLVYYLRDPKNSKVFEEYSKHIEWMTSSAKFYKDEYDRSVNGLEKSDKKHLQRSFVRNLRNLK